MRKPGQININDLYFGIVVEDANAMGTRDFLRTQNLFQSSGVLWSVAYWVASDDAFKKEHDLIDWCFSDVRSRCQYEFVVCPWGGSSGREIVGEVGIKVDTYRMYVKPNKAILEKMVNSVSLNSAKNFLKEYRKRMRPWRKRINTK